MLIAAGLLVGALVMIVALAWMFQRRLIYMPYSHPRPAAQVLPTAEEVTFTTVDGLVLAGWFVPALEAPAKATVLVFNGNAGNREFRAQLAAGLVEVGYAVLLFDYRGYGGNPGRPSEEGLIADARAARRWLASREGVDTNRLVYFGESLGSGVAVALSVEEPPAALVLRSPFTSLVDIGKMHYSVLPVNSLLKDRFLSIERIQNVECPLLIVAGDRDTLVPHAMSETLWEAARQESKQFLTIEGAGHNDHELTAGREMLRGVDRFLERFLDRDSPHDAER